MHTTIDTLSLGEQMQERAEPVVLLPTVGDARPPWNLYDQKRVLFKESR